MKLPPCASLAWLAVAAACSVNTRGLGAGRGGGVDASGVDDVLASDVSTGPDGVLAADATLEDAARDTDSDSAAWDAVFDGPVEAESPDSEIPDDAGPPDVASCAGECSPGAMESRSCSPRCGVQARVCSARCVWEPWGECVEPPGACMPGERMSGTACGRCANGISTRVCTERCAWSDEFCEGAVQCEALFGLIAACPGYVRTQCYGWGEWRTCSTWLCCPDGRWREDRCE
ncbi:MAG: hypothetical protein NZ898_15975 [Myxococcota bacterium]|nr:hypothetical protein [Myxococcota bacterium]MDW8362448.1 hypothetical protein [Myxococcales bacterium]